MHRCFQAAGGLVRNSVQAQHMRVKLLKMGLTMRLWYSFSRASIRVWRFAFLVFPYLMLEFDVSMTINRITSSSRATAGEYCWSNFQGRAFFLQYKSYQQSLVCTCKVPSEQKAASKLWASIGSMLKIITQTLSVHFLIWSSSYGKCLTWSLVHHCDNHMCWILNWEAYFLASATRYS